MKKRVLLIAIAALLLVMATTLAGCSFGAARLSLTFTPKVADVKVDQAIQASVTLKLEGFGRFNIKRVALKYYDENGDEVESAGEYDLPTGAEFEPAIPLFGTMGFASKTLSLKELNNDEDVTPTLTWWSIDPRPVKIVFTFFDDSGKAVGSGELGLKWEQIIS